jgi:type III pantothenate kinase
MLLSFDIGNTSIHLGLFDGEKVVATWRLGVETEKFPDEYGVLFTNLLLLKGYRVEDVDAVIISCDVPPLTPTVTQVARDYFNVEPLLVGHGLRTGVRILYENPRGLGSDRIVDAVAAIHLYGPPIIVVDFGTGTVFDAINEDGDYLGGAIAPGIGVASEALFRRGAMLSRVALETPTQAIGRNTVNALQSGILYGFAGLVDGIVNRFKEELASDKVQVVATGGWAEQIAPLTTTVDIVNQDLTLTGLRLIYELNCDKR